jgi:tetratricopeptide (TPR) repeat protein
MENCVGCHTKLPAGGEFDLAQQIEQDIDVEALLLEERVKLYVATRRFDAALDLYEEAFRSPTMIAENILLTGMLEDYMKLVVRVRGDFGRAVHTFGLFRQRTDVPGYLISYAEVWIDDLRDLQEHVPKRRGLKEARKLVSEAREQNLFAADRRGLVRFVAATSLLYDYLEERPTKKAQVAEAFFLLGVAESYLSRSYWVSETEFYLEKAIRIDPGSSIARKAFDFLEEHLVMGYTGAPGKETPPEVRALLDELYKLIEE